MSNPAVITLANASSKKGKFKRFVIEDNIGESIHLHIDNMRVDFSVKEFLRFSGMIKKSILKLDFLKGYSIENFDEHFLNNCICLLPKLKRIEIEEIELSELKCIVRTKYRSDLILQKLVNISETPAYKYLKGDKKSFLNYNQLNYLGMDNEDRLLKLVESIKNNGYSHSEKYLVLFNGQDIIRDGQHRAAVLSHFGIESKIKVMRFHFEGNKHLLNIHKKNLKTILKWLTRKLYRGLKTVLNRFRLI